LRLAGESAWFDVIEVPDIGEAPPDYTAEDDRTVVQREATWRSPFSPIQSSRRGAPGGRM
jgi:hypothetical protein